MSGQAIVFCPPPMPICRPQPAPWSYTPNWSGCQPSPYPQPSSCGCGCPPAAPLFGPIMGVTDGSNAGPGQVGEFLGGQVGFSYAAYPSITNQTVSLTVIPPGDWDLWAWIWLSTATSGAFFGLDPAPTGISNNMAGLNTFAGAGALDNLSEQILLLGAQARGSFSVPTLLPFVVIIDQSGATGLPAGTGELAFNARRRR